MELIEGIKLSKLCDYSFGDQSGQWSNIFTSFMKEANLTNTEFVSKLFDIKKSRDYMTLFIDNIRLYKRDIENIKQEDTEYVQSLMKKNDLLNLCSDFKDMNFIIFTNLEDTPIDEHIKNVIPENVICIFAVNALFWNQKVIPAPYGIQRQMHPNDDKIDVLKQVMEESIFPKNLLYVNHNENTNLKERKGINELFNNQSWSLVDKERVEYYKFLRTIKSFKFVLCPMGNAIDCHRNWEVLYLGRVPVMKKHPYLQELYKNYPVLFVDQYTDVTEELLKNNDFLYKKSKNLDISDLTLPKFYDNIVDKYKKDIK
jgi:ABC-type antimicrobial peptide transport system permease subunit